MCGRFTLTPAAQALIGILFDLDEAYFARAAEFLPKDGRHNIAPTQDVVAVRVVGGERRLDFLRWGLLVPWGKGPKDGPLLINARADTVAEKPSFKGALAQRRCLIPTDGFFEWAPPPHGAPKTAPKQPWWFRMRDESPFALAGLWEEWTPPDGPPVASFTLITTEANDVVAPVHDRMPVIVPQPAYAAWLDPTSRDVALVLPLLRPYPAEAMKRSAVSTRLNSARQDDPSLVEPVVVTEQRSLF
jgi:putative SOS response-associated peptidase YedK